MLSLDWLHAMVSYLLPPALWALLLAMASGIGEEALFRGALQPVAGLLLASLLFGLVHFAPRRGLWPWSLFALAGGLGLGALFDATGNLVAPVVAHATLNAVNLRKLVRDYGPAGRTPRQTKRDSIALNDAILPWIAFENPEFTRVLNWLREQTITETKGVFTDLIATVNGFDFVFGLGGIHGSVSSETAESTDEMVIVDIDVESYYPSTAIAQRFKPAHFPDVFCDIYAGLKEQRKSHKKGTAENAMLKLALNGVYGDTNNQFSVFYDPLMTMQITLNGQLLLCKLAENLMTIPGLRMTQANTDGLTLYVPRMYMDQFDLIVYAWEAMTNLKMEKNIYSKMFIRDVNNYIAVYENGKVKRKGAYEYDQDWHQNHGGLVIAKVTEQVLVHGAPIRETVEQWPDIMDFMLRTKVPRSSYLQWGEGQTQNISRYYVAKGGKPLFKWMPPLKGKTEWRKIAVESGWGVQVCNDIADAGKLPIDFEWYIQEVEKLCLSVM